MKILVLGGGLMGPAAAFNALSDADVSHVVVCDVNQRKLERCVDKLGGLEGGGKLSTVRLDLNDQAAAVRLLADYDVAIGALPNRVSILAVRAAIRAGTPMVDLARLEDGEVQALRREAEFAGAALVLGGGLEPGLTEIVARHLAEKLDRVDELHIKCGGIPETPTPPLGYKIVFGGRQLPLYESDALVVENGRLKPVPRYSGVETVSFPGVGQCEAWHEGFIPWLMDLPALKGLRVGTQKTVRWPGYASKVTVLKQMGLLSQEPVEVDGVRVVPKRLLDALLYPHVRLEEGERDITLFRVEVVGEQGGRPRRYEVEMVDRYDEVRGFTSMARTTAFTGAIIARMMGRGDLQVSGARTPEQVIVGPLFDRLLEELADLGVRFDARAETVETRGGGHA